MKSNMNMNEIYSISIYIYSIYIYHIYHIYIYHVNIYYIYIYVYRIAIIAPADIAPADIAPADIAPASPVLTHVPNVTKLLGENIARHEKEVGGHGREETKPGTSSDQKSSFLPPKMVI